MMLPRTVLYDVQPQLQQALHLRLTPGLLQALRQAQETGEAASIRFGDAPGGNVINVGGVAYPFITRSQDSCELLLIQGGSASSAGSVVAAVHQKLIVQRNVADERGRVRARAEEAEREKHERGALVLDGAAPNGKAGKGRPTERTVRRVTPPPAPQLQGPAAQQQAQQPQQQQQRVQPPAPAVLAPGLRPPAHPSGLRQPASSTPAPPAAGAKPLHKSASTGKLGSTAKLGSSSNLAGAAAAPPAAAVSPAVIAAARQGGLRGCLLVMLAERNMSPNGLSTAVKEVAARVRSFKNPSRDELQRTAKQLAELRAPGLYVLHDWVRAEGEQLLSDAKLLSSTSGAGKQRRSTPPVASDGSPPGVQPGSVHKRRQAAGSKRRVESSPDEEEGEEQGSAPATGREHGVQQQAAATPAAALQPTQQQQQQQGVGGSPASGSGASPPAGSRGRAGSGSLPRLKSSSSRGSHDFDDSWVEEHAQRQPHPAAPITTLAEYKAASAEFNRSYEAYFRLHQLIEAHKKDLRALLHAMQDAPTQADCERYSAQYHDLYRRRERRAARWDAAFRVLHVELSGAKERMAEYVQACKGRKAARLAQQAQAPGPAAEEM